MTDMLFSNNYLEDIPKDIQMSIMGIVEKLDAKEKKIMDTIHEVYEKSCEGDILYMHIEDLIRWNYPNDEEEQRTIENIREEMEYPVGEDDYIRETQKKYVDKIGIFKAMKIMQDRIGKKEWIDELMMGDNELLRYSTLYYYYMSYTFNNLFTDEEWDMIYKYGLYDKYIESLDLEGIDIDGFD
jgi:hypothetical protein